jgi:AcrR family transcriptional regulator
MVAKKNVAAKVKEGGLDDASTRKSQADRRAESTQKILDCAELNFAKLGFHGVTLVDIAKQCGMQTALIRYYYDDKQALLNAVFERRSGVINERRLAALRDYAEADDGNMDIRGLLEAYLAPLMSTYTDEGWRNFGSLVAQIGILPAWGGDTDIHRDTFDPVIRVFLEMLRELAPDVEDKDLYWYYHLLSGALIVTLSQTGQIDRISGGLCKSSDLATAAEHIASVFSSSFSALPRRQRKRARSGS